MYLESVKKVDTIIDGTKIEIKLRGEEEEINNISEKLEFVFNITSKQYIEELGLAKIFLEETENINNISRWVDNYIHLENKKNKIK